MKLKLLFWEHVAVSDSRKPEFIDRPERIPLKQDCLVLRAPHGVSGDSLVKIANTASSTCPASAAELRPQGLCIADAKTC